MKLINTFKYSVVLLACLGMLSSQTLSAAGLAPPTIRDVALHAGGQLKGQVVNEQAAAQANSQIAVVRDGKPLLVTQTDKNGRFVLAGLEPGLYELHLSSGGGAYRLWAPETAPPAASEGVLLVEESQVVRGIGSGNCFGWLSNPWVLAGIVAAAIAIPLALSDAS